MKASTLYEGENGLGFTDPQMDAYSAVVELMKLQGDQQGVWEPFSPLSLSLFQIYLALVWLIPGFLSVIF